MKNPTKFSLQHIHQAITQKDAEAQAAQQQAEVQRREDFFLSLIQELKQGFNPFGQHLPGLPQLQPQDYQLQYVMSDLHRDKIIVFQLDGVPIELRVSWNRHPPEIQGMYVYLDPRHSDKDWPTPIPFQVVKLNDLEHLARLAGEKGDRIVHPADIISYTRDDDQFYYTTRAHEDTLKIFISQLENTDLEGPDEETGEDRQDEAQALYQTLCNSTANGLPIPLLIAKDIYASRTCTASTAMEEAHQLLKAYAEYNRQQA
ncbi:hypothetical protein [Deinococcus cellulosilyticus]|uniref:Uncharacterized protein n=1 Tax=Deinococcus cellulosilyticus (strain DSM 18568 / NBRC 106333 / KACC 11606 / 5516J-15) TaxID=1223518 RepID=A0A511N733_DEIC1|nr:hypothetical protein [Deinococcus cellulosilyticus]GEM48654.1 hypothetical protein DC3_42890 [Deinococcus cellulosilyticus NBRC 106333 = KACC 11606]